jgi:hypothetical protein
MRRAGCVLGFAMFGLMAAVASCGVETEGAEGDQVDSAGADTVTETARALTSITNSCVCIGINATDGCGNGAVGGSNGLVRTGLSTATVIASYGPDRTGSATTGWACRPVGSNSCVCIGINATDGCGNGAIGGSNGVVKTGLSTATVIASYGPDRTGSARTGWKCRISGF